jgi:hypothetical protein
VTVDETPTARTTYLAVFLNREFSALWLAEALSAAGDQLARLALSLAKRHL